MSKRTRATVAGVCLVLVGVALFALAFLGIPGDDACGGGTTRPGVRCLSTDSVDEGSGEQRVDPDNVSRDAEYLLGTVFVAGGLLLLLRRRSPLVFRQARIVFRQERTQPGTREVRPITVRPGRVRSPHREV